MYWTIENQRPLELIGRKKDEDLFERLCSVGLIDVNQQ